MLVQQGRLDEADEQAQLALADPSHAPPPIRSSASSAFSRSGSTTARSCSRKHQAGAAPARRPAQPRPGLRASGKAGLALDMLRALSRSVELRRRSSRTCAQACLGDPVLRPRCFALLLDERGAVADSHRASSSASRQTEPAVLRAGLQPRRARTCSTRDAGARARRLRSGAGAEARLAAGAAAGGRPRGAAGRARALALLLDARQEDRRRTTPRSCSDSAASA